jgi:3-oxoisoapionate decarboxylase
VTIGTTSYGFRYLLQDPRRAPPLEAILEQARSLGLESLQICENARPLDLSHGEWKALIGRARDLGLEVELGCMTLDTGVLARYLERACETGRPTLRAVLEVEGGAAPTREELQRFLAAAAPRLERAGITLAVENHFHVPTATLAQLARDYPPALVGFCIDTANSLRNFETPEQVFENLSERALMYHLKDYRVSGTNVDFCVSGAPLGEGLLDLKGCLERILARHVEPRIFIENWVPASGDWQADVEEDRRWLSASLANLRTLLAKA